MNIKFGYGMFVFNAGEWPAMLNVGDRLQG